MRFGSDRLLLFLAILVLGGVVGTVVNVFLAHDAGAIDIDHGKLDEGEVDQAGVRRASGPTRTTTEKVVAVSEPKSERPVVLPQAGEGLISGLIKKEDDEPIADAKITISLYFPSGELNYGLVSKFEVEATSDEAGRFSVTVPAEGFYRVIVRHELHAPAMQEEIKVGAEVVFTMTAAAGMTGYVRSDAGGSIKAAKLRLRQEKGPWTETALTDEEGRFGIPGLPAGKVIVTVAAAGFTSLDEQVLDLEAGKVLERDFVLETGRAIMGTVVDENGSRVPRVSAKIGETQVTGDDIGRFKIGGLARSTHNIEIVAEGFLTYWQAVNLSGSRELAEIEVKLVRGGRVSGFVLDDTGTPVAGAEIKVFQTWGNDDYMWDSGETRYRTTTDEQGGFSIDGLAAERWSSFRARAAKEGFANAFSESFQVKDKDQPANISIVMRPGGTVSGTVRDESGRAISGVKMSINRNNVYEWNSEGSDGVESCLSDAEGHYSFERLSSGQYRVSAMARGFATAYKSDIKIEGAAQSEGNDFALKEGGIVKGSVKTPDGEPIPDALVQLNSKSSWGSGRTNAAGEYVIRNVGEGPYWASAYAKGFSRERKKEIFPIEERIDFELRRDGYVWGKVVEGDQETPVRQFRIELLQETSRNGSSTWERKSQIYVNDAEGKFKIYAPDGSYRLAVIAQGFIRKELNNVALSVDAEPEQITVKVVPGGAIEGWVRDEEGNPLTWVQVYYKKSGDDKYRQSGYTEQDGYYYLDSLEAGAYEVIFDRRGLMPLGRHEFVNVYGGGIVRLDHGLLDPTTVVFRNVVAEDGANAIRWARIKVTSLQNTPLSINAQRWNDEGGEHQLDTSISYQVGRGQSTAARELPPGSYQVEITSKGFETITQTITLRARDDVEFPFEMKKPEKDAR